MRSIRRCTVRVGSCCRRDGAGVRDRVGQRVRAAGAGEIEGFTLNDSTNFEKIKPGDGYGLDYSQSRLEARRLHLRPQARRHSRGRQVGDRAAPNSSASRADAFLAQPRGLYAQVYLRRNFTIDDAGKRTRFQCAAFHLTRDGAKPQDGYLCVTCLEQQVRQAPPHHA